MAECISNSFAPTSMLRELPENQGGTGRHLCCNCSYQQGIADSNSGWEPVAGEIVECQHGRMARLSMIEELHQNQGGTQRHKCVVCAYAIGFGEDLELINKTATPERELEENRLVIVEQPTVLEPKIKVRNFVPRKFSAKSQAKYASEIGLAGELFVLQKERERLQDANKIALSSNIIHVSQKLGDGAGYDILSYNEDGSHIYIEVKTTLGNSNRAFYISENELEFAKQNSESYQMYRVCNFDMERNSAELFVLNAEDLLKLNISPINYICEF